jgi:hypothetical protein
VFTVVAETKVAIVVKYCRHCRGISFRLASVSRVLLDKLIVAQPVKKFPTFYVICFHGSNEYEITAERLFVDSSREQAPIRM